MTYDVVIVGAGAAGLGAASHARALGLNYQIIEATSRIGGRAITVDLATGQPFDLGCHWLQGGERNPFVACIGTDSYLGPLVHGHSLWRGGYFADEEKTESLDQAFETLALAHLDRHRRSTEVHLDKDASIRDVLGGQYDFEDEYFRLLTHECAAEPEKVSICDPAGVNFGGDDIPVLSGYGHLIERAAGRVDVTLDCAATKIDMSGTDIAVETPRGTLRTRNVILTVSTAVLAGEQISFGRTGLPNWKLNAIEGVPMGSSTKVGLQFKKGTFERLYLAQNNFPSPNQLVIVGRDGASNGSWHLGTGDGELCTCYIGGQFSRELAMAGKPAQIAWAKEDLARILGREALGDVEAAETTPFDTLETLGGGYSYMRVGYPKAREDLERPVDYRLYFAGEACAGIDATTAHGAWSSGIRAIDQILMLLR